MRFGSYLLSSTSLRQKPVQLGVEVVDQRRHQLARLLALLGGVEDQGEAEEEVLLDLAVLDDVDRERVIGLRGDRELREVRRRRRWRRRVRIGAQVEPPGGETAAPQEQQEDQDDQQFLHGPVAAVSPVPV